MVTRSTADGLLDRQAEREAFDRFLERARGGKSSVLVVCGEPGIGKTALLDYATNSALGFRVLRVAGVESEIELGFAALQQLCAPLLDRLEQLPRPQRDALHVAFGLSAGHPPDRFLVALAVLSLMSEVAADQPLLVVVDDAQWLDRVSAQSLAFVARRLLAEPVALVFATREPCQELAGFPELILEGLGDHDARALLRSVIHARVNERVEQQFLADTRGNPLALLELPRGLTATELAGGFGVAGAWPLSRRIEEAFRRRLASLPADSRRLLVVAAAEPAGDPVLMWRAAEWLGIGVEAAEAAEADGLVRFGPRVTFRHPVVRSVVYQSASLHERRRAHRALAHVIDPLLDPDRRAWHRGQAAAGPDADVAAELERSAGRARARGGVACAAAFLERAAALTLDPACRTGRALAAAQAKYEAGAFEAARGLLETAEAGPLDYLQGAEIELLRAQIAFVSSRGAHAPPLLLKAAKRFERLDPARAREIYLEALTAAFFAGRLASGGVLEAAKAAGAAPPCPSAPRASDLLLDALVRLMTEGHGAAAPVLRRAVDAFCSQEAASEEGLRWLWLAAGVAGALWDFEAWDVLTARVVKLARDAGALNVLMIGLTTRSTLHVFAGELALAASTVEEAKAIAAACGSRNALYPALALTAFQGRQAEASQVLEAAGQDFRAAGEGMGLTVVDWANAVLYNGLTRYDDAFAAARQASEDPNELRFSAWALAELVEAASRTGHDEHGAHALERLNEIARATGTDWALGIAARSRALLIDDERAECLYRGAIDRSAGSNPGSRRARARPSPLRRVAAPRPTPARRPRAAAPSQRTVPTVRRRGVRRARADRAQSHRRARPQTHPGHA